MERSVPYLNTYHAIGAASVRAQRIAILESAVAMARYTVGAIDQFVVGSPSESRKIAREANRLPRVEKHCYEWSTCWEAMILFAASDRMSWPQDVQ